MSVFLVRHRFPARTERFASAEIRATGPVECPSFPKPCLRIPGETGNENALAFQYGPCRHGDVCGRGLLAADCGIMKPSIVPGGQYQGFDGARHDVTQQTNAANTASDTGATSLCGQSRIKTQTLRIDRLRTVDCQRRRVLALAGDFPRLWNDPATPQRERKRMARPLIEDVTLTEAARSLGVRLRGPTAHLDAEPSPFPAPQDHRRARQAVERSHHRRGRNDPQPARPPNRTRPRLRSDVGQAGPDQRRSQVPPRSAARMRAVDGPGSRRPTRGIRRHGTRMA